MINILLFLFVERQTPKRDISDYEKAQHLAHLIRSLLPYLKEFSDEQMKEIEIEANIQGTSFFGFGFSSLGFGFGFVVSTVRHC